MKFFLYLLLFLVSLSGRGQSLEDSADSVSNKRPDYKRLHQIFAAQTVLYGGTLYGLNKAWYKNSLNNFSFKDDSYEWNQIDKMGHAYTSYQIARHNAALYRLTGISEKQAIIYGAIAGVMFQTPIEILDGFSPDYGFSMGDMAANIAGPLLFAGQYLLWNEIRIHPKFSFHGTELADVRPELLGRSWSEKWLKDYNGQTYWFSGSPGSFSEGPWPKWLCLSVGYGIHDMVAGDPAKSREMGYNPYRQYYLSLDIDFTRINTRNKFLKTLGFLLNNVKVPFPALEFSRHGVRFQPFYF